MAEIQNEDLAGALAQFSMLRYFPADEMAHESIVLLLRRLCGTRERLMWLISRMVDHVGYWPGPAEVRGLFCTRFRPADGVEADCTLPGYTAADGEATTERATVKALPKAEAVKLLEGLRDPEMERRLLEKQIAQLQAKVRAAVGKPEVVKALKDRIAAYQKQIAELEVAA